MMLAMLSGVLVELTSLKFQTAREARRRGVDDSARV